MSLTHRKAPEKPQQIPANLGVETSSLKFKDKPPTFKYQKCFTRIVISSAVFIIIYFTSKKEKNVTFGGINENIHIREQKLECAIENIPNEPRIFSKCETSTCGRFVSDQILTESEANNLKYEIINLFDKSSKNEKIESMTEKITNDNGELRDTIKVVLPKVLQIISEKFNVHHDSIHLAYDHSFIARISNITTEFSERLHHLHHDSEVHETVKFSSFIFLSTFKKEFTEGKLLFADMEKGKRKNNIVESKLGRMVGFSSGKENVHLLQKVNEGTLVFLKLLFVSNKETCDVVMS